MKALWQKNLTPTQVAAPVGEFKTTVHCSKEPQNTFKKLYVVSIFEQQLKTATYISLP